MPIFVFDAKEEPKQIVVAWADKTAMEKTGRTVMRDLNYFPEFRPAWEGKAVMWIRKGTHEDEAKARSHASSIDSDFPAEVFVYPKSESDPLGRAKSTILAKAKSSGR